LARPDVGGLQPTPSSLPTARQSGRRQNIWLCRRLTIGKLYMPTASSCRRQNLIFFLNLSSSFFLVSSYLK
jgi:hypothetical protein